MPTVRDRALQVAIDHLREGVQVIGFDWTYLYLNETAGAHGRRHVAELIGRPVLECFPAMERTEMYDALQRVMRTRRGERLLHEFVYAGGDRAWLDLVIEPVPDGICVISSDVSDRRAIELQLRQAQKLEALGRLSGGIAHDFNNLLTAILGYSELALAQPHTPALGSQLREIRKAGERAARLTRQLLTFSRKQASHIERVDLSVLLDDMRSMLHRLLGDVRIVVDLEAGAAHVLADRTHVEQALVNVAINARDAMPGGGRLTIRTRVAAPAGEKPDACVALVIEDTGVGMAPDVLAHALDPFFTTKDPGAGTGLGLSSVQDAIRQSGGILAIDSTPNVGTTVTMYLPRSHEAPAEAGAGTDSSADAVAGSETICVIEQDDAVRTFVARVLRDCGYTVLECAVAEEASLRLATHAGPVHALITDVIMPDVHGPHFAQRVIERHPRVKVLFTPGYANSSALASGALGSRARVLPKPFTPASLVTELRALLDA